MLPPISGGGGRRRCRRRRRRSRGRWWPEAVPAGRERAKNLLWAAGKLADYGIGLGLEVDPAVLLHPSVTERFTRCAPGTRGWRGARCAPTCGSSAWLVLPHLYPADLPMPRERSKQPYSRAEISGYLALANAQPTAERRMRAAGLNCRGAGAGLIRGDLRDARGSDVIARSGGVVVTVRGARALLPRRAGAGPLPCPAAGRRVVRRDRADLRRRRSGAPEPDEPADHRAGRRDRPAPAGHQPGGAPPGWPMPRSCWGWPRSCTRPGSHAPSGWVTWWPGWSRPARPRRSGCSAAPHGDDPADGIRAGKFIDASGIPPRIEAMLPIGVRPRQLKVRTLLGGHVPGPGRRAACPPDPRSPGADQPAGR